LEYSFHEELPCPVEVTWEVQTRLLEESSREDGDHDDSWVVAEGNVELGGAVVKTLPSMESAALVGGM